MSMTRTFHTVGQGAFYTERHQTDNGKFTIVYDCGSGTSKMTPKALEKKINSAFSDKDVKDEIDILFISHFHADHINGLEFLKNNFKIKNVVLPLLDEKDKEDKEAIILLKVSNYLSCGNLYSDLIDNPAGFFGKETVIIKVKVNDSEEAVFTERQENTNTTIDIDNLDLSGRHVQIESGTKITSKLIEELKWFFIPFNYKHDERKIQFKDALSKQGLSLTDIDTITKIQSNKRGIVAAYKDKTVKGDLNQNSMILFSGFGKSSYLTRCFSNNWHFPYPCCWFPTESGCIYFGDIDLNQVGIIDNIKARLNSFLPFVGTIQIPHHGSKENFDSDMLNNLPQIECAVISFGTDNLYGHPSSWVIIELLHKRIYPHFVTEKQDSVVIQHN